jgi:tetratricopeptide (TPR) repeat protein
MFRDQGKYARAEPVYRRALAIREKALGPDHADLVATLDSLAWICYAQRKFAEAEPLYLRALVIWEKAVGPEHPTVAQALDNLAEVHVAQQRYAQAEPLYRRALAIRERSMLAGFDKLAGVYVAQKRFPEAEALYQRALAVAERRPRSDPAEIGMILERYAQLLRLLERPEEATRLEARLARIRAQIAEEMRRADEAALQAKP